MSPDPSQLDILISAQPTAPTHLENNRSPATPLSMHSGFGTVLWMRRWFLSYHSADQALAERLRAAIERQDAGSRVFFAPTSLRAGGYWQPALANEIEAA